MSRRFKLVLSVITALCMSSLWAPDQLNADIFDKQNQERTQPKWSRAVQIFQFPVITNEESGSSEVDELAQLFQGNSLETIASDDQPATREYEAVAEPAALPGLIALVIGTIIIARHRRPRIQFEGG